MASERKLIRDILDYALAGGMLYISLHPQLVGEIEERARTKWREMTHSFSVGQAIRAIRSLPETETTETTETKGDQ